MPRRWWVRVVGYVAAAGGRVYAIIVAFRLVVGPITLARSRPTLTAPHTTTSQSVPPTHAPSKEAGGI
jgi:hypothetical protein